MSSSHTHTLVECVERTLINFLLQKRVNRNFRYALSLSLVFLRVPKKHWKVLDGPRKSTTLSNKSSASHHSVSFDAKGSYSGIDFTHAYKYTSLCPTHKLLVSLSLNIIQTDQINRCSIVYKSPLIVNKPQYST